MFFFRWEPFHFFIRLSVTYRAKKYMFLPYLDICEERGDDPTL